MARCLIVYYSCSGTTAKIAEHIKEGLLKSGCKVDLCNIDDHKPRDLTGYDLLGFGSPVFYFHPTFEMRDFIKQLPDLNGIPAFVFVAYGVTIGKAVSELCSLIKQKGAREVGTITCRNANFIIGLRRDGEEFRFDHIRSGELAEAEAFGIKLAKEVLTETVSSETQIQEKVKVEI